MEGVTIKDVMGNVGGQEETLQDVEATREVLPVESKVLKDALLATRDTLFEMTKDGIDCTMKLVGEGHSKQRGFVTPLKHVGDGFVVHAVSSGDVVIDEYNHKNSGRTIRLDAYTVQDRGEKGPLVTVVSRNASSTTICVLELKDTVPFADFAERDFGEFSQDEIERYEEVKMHNDIVKMNNVERRIQKDSMDGEFQILTEKNYSTSPNLYHAVSSTFQPLAKATADSLRRENCDPHDFIF